MQTEPVTRRCTRTPRLEGALPILLGVLLVALAAACAKPPPDTDAARGQAVERPLGESVVGDLACAAGDCVDWNRIRLDRPGDLRLDARVVRSDTPNAIIHITLENGRGDLIATLENVGNAGQGIQRRLDKGVYLVEIRANLNTKPIIYDFKANFDPIRVRRSKPTPLAAPAAPKPPPEPVFRREPAEVLKVEGRLAEPTAVFLDVSASDGVSIGQRGELVEADGTVVGTFRVSEIYDDASRAAVDLPLRRAVTPSVGAVLLFEVTEESAAKPKATSEATPAPTSTAAPAPDDASGDSPSTSTPTDPPDTNDDLPTVRDRDRRAPEPRPDPDDPWAL